MLFAPHKVGFDVPPMLWSRDISHIPIPFLSFGLQEPCSGSLCLLAQLKSAEAGGKNCFPAQKQEGNLGSLLNSPFPMGRTRDSALGLPKTASLWEVWSSSPVLG